MKRFLQIFGGLGIAFLGLNLAGCAQNGGASNFAQSALQDMNLARSYDQAQLALTRGDQSHLDDLGAQIRARMASSNNDANSQDAQLARVFVRQFVDSAAIWENESAQTSGKNRENAREKSARSYRSALVFLPTKTEKSAFLESLGAQNLNALGYFLADRGENIADWTRAEALTRLAFELSPTETAFDEFNRAVGPQDSHAWALYKLGRFAEARAVQTQVLQLIGKSNNVGETNLSPDIPFHMGAIYKALGQSRLATRFFNIAIEQGADEDLRDQIEILEKSRAI